jgi:hypothetical protein
MEEVAGGWRKVLNVEPQFLLLTKYYLANEINNNEKSRACGTHRTEAKCIEGFGGKT